MVGRKVFGMIDRRLRQAFPRKSQVLFGGCSVLLFGDFGQLPPCHGPSPLHYCHTIRSLRSRVESLQKAFTLTQVMRQAGQDPEQIQFRNILLHLRNAEVTVENWQHNVANTNKDSRSVSIC